MMEVDFFLCVFYIITLYIFINMFSHTVFNLIKISYNVLRADYVNRTNSNSWNDKVH